MSDIRQPKGQPTGGQFAAHSRPDGTIDLAAARADAERANEESYRALVRSDVANARYIAAAIRDAYPAAQTVVLGESDQEGCTWQLDDVLDADGSSLGEQARDDLGDELTPDFWSLPEAVRDPDRPELYAWLVEGPNGTRHTPDMRFDIDKALATNPETI